MVKFFVVPLLLVAPLWTLIYEDVNWFAVVLNVALLLVGVLLLVRKEPS